MSTVILRVVGACLSVILLAFATPSYAQAKRAVTMLGGGKNIFGPYKMKASIMTVMPDCGDPSCQCPWGEVVNNVINHVFLIDDFYGKTFCAYIRAYGAKSGSNIRIFPATRAIYFDCTVEPVNGDECSAGGSTYTSYSPLSR